MTISDTREPATDRSGRYLRETLLKAGHLLVDYRILRDDPKRITAHLKRLARQGEARLVLMSGGTGIARRDNTYDALTGLLEKRLDGFGEIFRALSFRQVGPSAMLSRATAGTYRGLVIFSMPGSEKAVRLAMRRLILPEMAHIAGLIAPDRRRLNDQSSGLVTPKRR